MKSELRFVVKPVLLTVSITAAFASLHYGWWGYTEKDLLEGLFLLHWSIAWPAFVLTGVVFTALGGPRQVLAFSSGYLMGGLTGAVASTLITGLGAGLTMVLARRCAGDWLQQRHAAQVDLLRRLLAQDTWLWVCIIRLMPVGHNLATNIAAGMAGLPFAPFLLGSVLGFLPQMLLFSYAGSGIALNSSSQLWFSLALLVGSTALGTCLYFNGLKQRLERLRADAAPSGVPQLGSSSR